jgi:metal-responsive CopG/Arc/MetJ family transcriptional regulator
MSEKKQIRVRNWPQVSSRIDPDVKKDFDKKLKENGDDKSEVIRRAIREYTRRS